MFRMKTSVCLRYFANDCSLTFTEPWALLNDIMLNIMQNCKFYFMENEFWDDWDVHFKFISRTLNNFSTVIFSKYGGRARYQHFAQKLLVGK